MNTTLNSSVALKLNLADCLDLHSLSPTPTLLSILHILFLIFSSHSSYLFTLLCDHSPFFCVCALRLLMFKIHLQRLNDLITESCNFPYFSGTKRLNRSQTFISLSDIRTCISPIFIPLRILSHSHLNLGVWSLSYVIWSQI